MQTDREDEWLTTGQIAELLRVSRSTVLRKLSDPDQRAKWFPVDDDWRIKPLTEGHYQVRRRAVDRLLRRGDLP